MILIDCLSETYKYWFLGLTEGEGCFDVSYTRTQQGRKYLSFRFSIEMVEDEEFFKDLKFTFGGHIYKRKNRNGYIWSIRKSSEIFNIIKFFKGLRWRTKKYKQYMKFKGMFVRYKKIKHGQRELINAK
jgi:hypothetical protein|tara:strand:- start:47 stop:433 length:387 start_codon:yes stop_codon:yes gene_type:complete